jgi:hypothetical protein
MGDEGLHGGTADGFLRLHDESHAVQQTHAEETAPPGQRHQQETGGSQQVETDRQMPLGRAVDPHPGR